MVASQRLYATFLFAILSDCSNFFRNHIVYRNMFFEASKYINIFCLQHNSCNRQHCVGSGRGKANFIESSAEGSAVLITKTDRGMHQEVQDRVPKTNTDWKLPKYVAPCDTLQLVTIKYMKNGKYIYI